jgi:hypothetical protein
VQRPVLQILVVVANTQARTLRAEVEQGFLRTAFGQELVDPKTRINLALRRDVRVVPSAASPSVAAGLSSGGGPKVGRGVDGRGRPGSARPGVERESGQHSRTRVRASPR